MPEPSHPSQADPHPTAATYGVYRVVRPLGEGASGRVFLAERTDFAQRVALKVFDSAFLTAGLVTAAEPQLLASLDHRHIVRVLQGGVTPAGVRYLAMEYIDGEDIVTFCAIGRLPLAARVRLLLQVLDAVEHAHRRLVIHGDLKPANILVTTADDTGPQAKLLDFGSAASLAATLGAPPASEDETTTAHTPAFASPEQRSGARTTVASDIYSLGLLTRVLLAGGPPAANTAGASRPETPPPAAQPPARPLTAGQQRDLKAILGRALQPAPEDRYGTAGALAADLRAFAEGRTPAVRQASLPERLRKWTLRHKLPAAAAAVLLGTLLFSAVGVAVETGHARRSRREAEARLRELVQLTGTLQSELYGSVRALPNAGASEKLLTDSAAATLDQLAAAEPADPTLRAELAAQYAQLARLELDQAHEEARVSAAVPQPAAPPASRPAFAAASVKAVRHLRRALAFTAADDPQRPERARLLATLSSPH